MSSIIVCGAGPVGLASAIMLARDGHEVTVLEADPRDRPARAADAWADWRRPGVAQFRQPHNLFARSRQVLDRELPGMVDRLLAAGCVWVDYLQTPPPGVTDPAPRPGDDALRCVTGRRAVFESVFAAAAGDAPGVTVRRGVRVAGLLAGPAARPDVPHVGGVVLADGTQLRADLVVDAMGRRSPGAGWLVDLGAAPPLVESQDLGFVYYTRYFSGPRHPLRYGPPLAPMGRISLLTLEADNDTWSVTVFGISGDPAIKALRDPDCFTRVWSAYPPYAHWLDGTPISDVLTMAGGLDKFRRFVVDGVPIVTGYAAVGDAWASTNPSAGRGVSLGLMHAQVLRAAVRSGAADPAAFVTAFERETRRVVEPYCRDQLAADRVRIAEMRADRQGVALPPADSPMARLVAGAEYDADLFRAMLELLHCLATADEVLSRPVIAPLLERASGHRPQPMPGPDHTALLQLLAA
jgi:2-polyprenyl-6-methoxyphenol hydroxylase-like FAD-dependent oxidoreductase